MKKLSIKTGCRIVVVLIVLSFAVTGILISLLPDTIPAHYNFAGEVDRYGSKYEHITFPIIAGLFGSGYALWARHMAKKKEQEDTARVLIYVAMFGVLLFTGMGIYYAWKAVAADPSIPAVMAAPDAMKFISIAVGLLLVLLGNVMPKATRNALFGLRTKWSMANDEAWRRSQRFGGFASVITGFVLVIASIFLEGMASLIFCSIAGILWAALCIAASRYFYLQTSQKEEKL